jgi:two-component system sensor histidine kinase MprB
VSLRWRIALGLALVAALVGTIAGVGAYVTTVGQLRSAVDETMLARAAGLDPFGRQDGDDRPPQADRFVHCPTAGALQPAAAAQLVAFDGRSRSCIQDGPVLPIDDEDLAVANDPRARPILRTISQDGTSYRQLTMPWSQGVALQIARDLSELESTLQQLRLRLVLLTLAGVAGAAALGWVLAGRIVRPVTRLRDAAEDIAATNDLTTPLPTDGPGEVGSLAQSLSSMMAALATSQEQQQRLVTDASHELRTPLTTLRTNVEHLQRAPDLPTEQRQEVLADIEVESRELTDLVNELVELSTDRSSTDEEPEVVDLADLAQTVAARAQRRTGRVIVVAHTGESLVSVRPRMVERAISNLVDNGIKYSPVDTTIDVTVAGPSLVVRDHGPGIDADDQPHVFDRFYRATTARTAPGSGLGLAIVRQIVERHGGEVWAANAADGGATVGMRLPPAGAP